MTRLDALYQTKLLHLKNNDVVVYYVYKEVR